MFLLLFRSQFREVMLQRIFERHNECAELGQDRYRVVVTIFEHVTCHTSCVARGTPFDIILPVAREWNDNE